ncbi:GNAT family N-acetyltransferase [Tropicimonas isoalkanivorans]|uniref:Acetyltransferase (GNAT) family protein n=1 Tax=Tropicimonas isoalkanivorans TaxID=441112 RepID=A0A1I1ND26_9RHOB|nr:GNAT family N-acetyltransferase [Tropicimonas isoalkanivorans]SFC92693.1 Acetyltransferase (GNAT) family protein [Tropicimonas isoalkanivorans]
MKIEHGFPEGQRGEVAALFWQAFSGKLGWLMAPEARALDFIERALRPEHALTAFSDTGTLLGVVGIKTWRGGLLTGDFPDLARVYGRLGAVWRGPLLDLMDRPLGHGQMVMDGLFVDRAARGMGVGTALIGAIMDEAQAQGMKEVRLDVIDTNLRARALYERHGFTPTGRKDTGIFKVLFGYHHATTMSRLVDRR